MTGCVFNIQRFSVHDGPGIRTNVFLKGCPLRCVWCHNPEGLDPKPQLCFSSDGCIACGDCAAVCPASAHKIEEKRHVFSADACRGCMNCARACPAEALVTVGQWREAASVIEEVLLDADYYGDRGGMTLSGGEPFYQPEFAMELLRLAKKAELNCAVETCGFVPQSVLLAAAPYVDTFLYDFKLADDEAHFRLTGVHNRTILENLSGLDAVGAYIVLRCPIIPGVNNTRTHYAEIARLAQRYENIREINIMPYHSIGIGKGLKLGTQPAFKAESMSYEAAEAIRQTVQNQTNQPVCVI